MKKLTSLILVLVVGATIFLIYKNEAQAPSEAVLPSASQAINSVNNIFSKSRITKKPFGIYITPATSPVQPEKFTGYHTGVDFETTAEEQNIDVRVPALFDGKLVLKKYATGYGGVLVEESVNEGQPITIIYGHLKLASITGTVGQYVKKGDILGVLGKGYSTETDGERKHLHLGIHIGTTINILGYVQKQSDLSGWIDATVFIK